MTMTEGVSWAVYHLMISLSKLTRLRSLSWQCPPMPTKAVFHQMIYPAQLTRLAVWVDGAHLCLPELSSFKDVSGKAYKARSRSWWCPPMPTWAVFHLVASPALCSVCRPRSLSHTDSPRKRSIQEWVFYCRVHSCTHSWRTSFPLSSWAKFGFKARYKLRK
jgi:hypothetical protein